MLIGLDAIPLTEPRTGVGHYTFELARALAHVSPSDSFELLYPSSYAPIDFDGGDETPHDADGDDAAQTSALASNLKAVRVRVGHVGRHWWSAGLPLYLRRSEIELFHGTNYDVPLWGRAPSALTIHDLSLLLHPETHEARRVRRARRRLPLMARAATVVITPTESVRREVCERLARVPPTKVFAVPEAPRDIFRPLRFDETEEARRRLGVEDEYLLAVGTLEPRKNLIALLRAFEEVARALPSRRLQLVVSGGKGWLNAPLFAQLEKSEVKDRVLFTGYVSDEDLRALYASCRAFVYPSLYEGFGLPPLEAMACGAPVIAGRIPSIVETTGGAALLFDPADTHELARRIVELLRDEGARRKLSEAGLRRAAGFSWEQTARLTREVYGEALRRFE
jgi:alpha-1,3-rhamnosyl/mannosyltransferase